MREPCTILSLEKHRIRYRYGHTTVTGLSGGTNLLPSLCCNIANLNYGTIIELAKHGGSDKDVSTAMDTALGKTIDYFERHSYYMSRNEDLYGGGESVTCAWMLQ